MSLPNFGAAHVSFMDVQSQPLTSCSMQFAFYVLKMLGLSSGQLLLPQNKHGHPRKILDDSCLLNKKWIFAVHK